MKTFKHSEVSQCPQARWIGCSVTSNIFLGVSRPVTLFLPCPLLATCLNPGRSIPVGIVESDARRSTSLPAANTNVIHHFDNDQRVTLKRKAAVYDFAYLDLVPEACANLSIVSKSVLKPRLPFRVQLLHKKKKLVCAIVHVSVPWDFLDIEQHLATSIEEKLKRRTTFLQVEERFDCHGS